MTRVVEVDASAPDARAIADAAECLRAGRLVAFPTETVYGLGAHALDRDAVRRLFAAKARPATDPLIVHVGSVEAVRALVSVLPDAARQLAERFWPGPLTLVMRRSRVVPDEVTAGLDTVAVRVPAHPVARALIDAAALPVAAPSANLFSRPSPTRASHVLEDLDGRIDLVLDAGPTAVGIESTVLDLSRTTPVILRPGVVTIEMLRPLLPGVIGTRPMQGDGTSSMPSPGMLDRHYSPRAPLTLYEGEGDWPIEQLVAAARRATAAGQTVGVLAASEDRAALAASAGSSWHVADLGPFEDPGVVAARLYAALRELDAANVDVILARAFPAPTGVGVAVADRLRRAAAGRIVRPGSAANSLRPSET